MALSSFSWVPASGKGWGPRAEPGSFSAPGGSRAASTHVSKRRKMRNYLITISGIERVGKTAPKGSCPGAEWPDGAPKRLTYPAARSSVG